MAIDPAAAAMVPASVVVAAVNESTEVTAISCGSSHSLAILSCGLLVAWGRGEDGQLGLGDPEDRLSPTSVSELAGKSISGIACGAEYSVAISASQQRVYSWGWGDFGRLGHGDCRDAFLPKSISALEGMRITACSCGDTHSVCLAEDGSLWAFGRNANGQLGLEGMEDRSTPCRVEAMKDHHVVSISCGAEHTVASTQAGEVYAWGWGRYGNMGDGEQLDRSVPTKAILPEGHHVTSVASGWRHSMALDTRGRVLSWGWGAYGQLGHNSRNDESWPRVVEALSEHFISRVVGGWRHTLAIDTEGHLFSWGWNKFGQLGTGGFQDEVEPRVVEAVAGETAVVVSAGWRHSCVVTAEGSLFSWGRGCNGQLGYGGSSDRDVPQRVATLAKGHIDEAALCNESAAAAAFVAPSDRYAVVPGGFSSLQADSSSGPPTGAAVGVTIAKRQKL